MVRACFKHCPVRLIGTFVLVVFLGMWIVAGAPAPSKLIFVQRSIDTNTGDIKVELRLGTLLLLNHVETTRFSRAVRRYFPAQNAPVWRPISGKYYMSGMREDYSCTGADVECRYAYIVVSSLDISDAERKVRFGKYLSLLREARVAAMHDMVQRDGGE